MTIWVITPEGGEIAMTGSQVDDLYAEALRLRAEVTALKAEVAATRRGIEQKSIPGYYIWGVTEK